MTLLPLESRDVRGLDGPEFPAYKVPPVCSAPGCSRFVDHTHHLFRRSALAGPYAWVELPSHTIVGNLAGLCIQHHDDITLNLAWIIWDERERKFFWKDNIGAKRWVDTGELYPQPPIHGQPQLTEEEQKIVGPAASAVCPGCHRPIPRKDGEKRDPARRRKTWTVTVPADSAEDGALVLDTLLEECRKLFSHGEEKNVRYFSLVQALALVVQHGHLLTGDGNPAN